MKLTRRQKTIISNGVKNLIEFGYPSVDNKNIFTDTIYSEFFYSMLQDNIEDCSNEELKADFLYIKELVDDAKNS